MLSKKSGQRYYSYCTSEPVSSPGMGNEDQKCSSLLKDITTEWYPGWGWSSLPLDEAQLQHLRAFKADMAWTKLKGSQGSHGKFYSCFMLSGEVGGKEQDPRLKEKNSLRP